MKKMTFIDKKLEEFEEKFRHIGNKGVVCDSMTIQRLRDFFQTALKECRKQTIEDFALKNSRKLLSVSGDLEREIRKTKEFKHIFDANLSSFACAGCGSVNSPDGSNEGYYILDDRGIRYPWHKYCASKALAHHFQAVKENDDQPT